jgi:hypothetical protein
MSPDNPIACPYCSEDDTSTSEGSAARNVSAELSSAPVERQAWPRRLDKLSQACREFYFWVTPWLGDLSSNIIGKLDAVDRR